MQSANIERFPDHRESISWDIREVLRDVGGKPHLMLRVEISGVHFPERALIPFMSVGGVTSQKVLIDPDGQRARGYFDRPLPERGRLAFGYGNQVTFAVPGEPSHPVSLRLDRERLPAGTVLYEKR